MKKLMTKVQRRLGYEARSWMIGCKYEVFKCKHSLAGLDAIKTDLNKQDKMELFDVVLKSDCECIVEIGSYVGASSCIISQALERKGRNDARLYCIDTWCNDAMTEGARDTYREFLKNTESCSPFIVPLQGLSSQVAVYFEERDMQIDVLFIDGDHSYAGCKKDWDVYRPLLRDQAVVVFHDYGWAEGVKRVVHEDVRPLLCEERELRNMFVGWLGP